MRKKILFGNILISILISNHLLASPLETNNVPVNTSSNSKVIDAFNQVPNNATANPQLPQANVNQITNSNNTQTPQEQAGQQGQGFKSSLVNQVNDKMDRITKTLEENALKEQMQREQKSQQVNSQMSGLALPVVVGTTIITKPVNDAKKNSVVYKQAMVVDENGNRYSLNERNNSIIKTINNDYIDFKDSNTKIPILITNNKIKDDKAELKVTNTIPITTIADNFKAPPHDATATSLQDNVIKQLAK